MGINKDILFSILKDAGQKIVHENQHYKNGLEFQTALFECLKAICDEKGNIDCKQTGEHIFPDILIDNFGIEAKLANGDKWISTGNSVTESTKIQDLEDIYIFFLQQNNDEQKFKFRKYEECLSDIVVTHSPRFAIDMDLKEGTSVLDQMKIAYKEFNKTPRKLQRIREYLKSKVKEGQELWWIDEDKDESISPIIKDYSALSKLEKEKFIADVFIIFPDILSNSNTKFIKPAVFLLREYQVLNSHFRDEFSAGGRDKIKIGKNKKIDVSRVLLNLFRNANKIEKNFDKINLELIKEYWDDNSLTKENLRNRWLQKIDNVKIDENIKPSKIYLAGLKIK
jgi:hypothetical protein